MKLRFLCSVVAAALLLGRSTSAITAEQLAAFFNVSSWQTVVDLPAETYSIELYEIADGAVTERVAESQPAWTRKPEAGITIMSGLEEGNYKVAIVFSSGGTVRAATKVARLDRTIQPTLPAKVREGDFVLFGKPAEGDAARDFNEVKSYSRGILLRIKKA
jgi:hypothetical protein